MCNCKQMSAAAILSAAKHDKSSCAEDGIWVAPSRTEGVIFEMTHFIMFNFPHSAGVFGGFIFISKERQLNNLYDVTCPFAETFLFLEIFSVFRGRNVKSLLTQIWREIERKSMRRIVAHLIFCPWWNFQANPPIGWMRKIRSITGTNENKIRGWF